MLRCQPVKSEPYFGICGCGHTLQAAQVPSWPVHPGKAGRQPQHTKARAGRPVQAIPDTAEAPDAAVASTSGRPSQVAPPKSQVWEIDFFSRPIYDERGKKRWELLICDQERKWEFVQSFPNNKITSAALKTVLDKVLALPGAEKPLVALFFRRQMVTIISRALRELDIVPLSSQRCFALLEWLEERFQNVYKKDPTYKEGGPPVVNLELDQVESLRKELRADRWNFVQLPWGVLKEELRGVTEKQVYGNIFPLEQVKLQDQITDDTLIPGVAMFNRFAAPMMAMRTDEMQLASVGVDKDMSSLILQTGINKRFRYGAFKRTPENVTEAEAWEAAKLQCGGLHFLAIQEMEDSEKCSGMWLLIQRPLPDY